MLDPEWVRLLRIDDKVFLTKEQEVAVVEMPYYHEERYKSGKITIKRWGWSKSEIWYIRPDGTGIDGSQIMTPYGYTNHLRKAVESKEESVIMTDRWETI